MFADKLHPFLDRYDEISTLLSDPNIANDIEKMTKLSKEQSSIEPVATAAKKISTNSKTTSKRIKPYLRTLSLASLQKMSLKI